MGIEASYRRITPAEWESLHSLAIGENALSGSEAETAFIEFVCSDEFLSGSRYLSIEKEWHALHAMLTGDVCEPSEIKPFPAPLGNVVIGGTETPFSASYGKVRVLTPTEVREVADAIGGITDADLRSRFDAAAFTEAKVYPNPRPGGWDLEQIEASLYYYPQLVEFFNEAAQDGNVVLLSFD